MGAKGGVIISDARITSLSKFRASRVWQHQYTVSREDGTILDGGYGVLEFDRSNVTEHTTLEWLEGN